MVAYLVSFAPNLQSIFISLQVFKPSESEIQTHPQTTLTSLPKKPFVTSKVSFLFIICSPFLLFSFSSLP